MKYKYLAISGKEIDCETEETKEQLLDSFFYENGIMCSMTPVVEIDGIPFWNKVTDWGTMTKKQWIKNICPKLRKLYN